MWGGTIQIRQNSWDSRKLNSGVGGDRRKECSERKEIFYANWELQQEDLEFKGRG